MKFLREESTPEVLWNPHDWTPKIRGIWLQQIFHPKTSPTKTAFMIRVPLFFYSQTDLISKKTKCFAQLVVGVEPRIMSNLRFDFGPKSRVSEVGWFGREKLFVTMDVYLWKGAVLLRQAEWNWIREAFHEVMFYRYFENVCISVILLCILYS